MFFPSKGDLACSVFPSQASAKREHLVYFPNTAYELNIYKIKGKKAGPYKEAVAFFRSADQVKIEINDNICICAKREKNDEFQYIFFSQKLAEDQLAKKKRKFERELKKGTSMEKKVLAGKELGRQVYAKGWIISEGKFQKALGGKDLENYGLGSFPGKDLD
jgi:hypothetical protein